MDLEQFSQSIIQHGYAEQRLLDKAIALNNSSLSGSTIGAVAQALIDMGIISEEALYDIYAQLTGLKIWQGDGEFLSECESLSRTYMAFNRILPVKKDEQLLLITDDATDEGLHEMLTRLIPEAEVQLLASSVFNPLLDENFSDELSEQESEEQEFGNENEIEHLKDLALEAPIIRLVTDMINTAVRLGASDIHLEPFRHTVELRYRVDGVLLNRAPPSPEDYPAVISRIKILAELDIAERRLPQDGRIRTKSAGRDIDLRISTLPTPYGEDVVMRLLDKKGKILTLNKMGLSLPVLNSLKGNLKKSHGIILVTGPTGSGKTTTLYAALQSLIDGHKKIITVEDPVEYEIAGISQIAVNESIGMTFAKALRSILRHDPDIIFIGEIRDLETAEIAIQSSLTGHLVLSTLHTNTAMGAITRFMDMGIPDYLLASSLQMVTAQRLVRRLCEHCKTIDEELERTTRSHFQIPENAIIYKPVGCNKCAQSGYSGRLLIAEYREMNTEIRNAILNEPNTDVLEQAAVKSHDGNLMTDGIRKVVQGITSMEEVLRVAG